LELAAEELELTQRQEPELRLLEVRQQQALPVVLVL